MDDEADRDPEPPASIEERRETRARLDEEFRERQRDLDDGIPETHDDLHNPADYEPIALWEALHNSAENVRQFHDDPFDPLAATIGRVDLFPHFWEPGDLAGITQNLDGREALRVYLYFDLSVLPEYRVADRLDFGQLRDELSVSTAISQSTLNRLPGRMDERIRRYYASESETLVRQLQGTPYEDWVWLV